MAADASSSTDDKGIIAYAWDFGDGYVSESVTAAHTYASPGTYVVTLEVFDAEGLSDGRRTLFWSHRQACSREQRPSPQLPKARRSSSTERPRRTQTVKLRTTRGSSETAQWQRGRLSSIDTPGLERSTSRSPFSTTTA